MIPRLPTWLLCLLLVAGRSAARGEQPAATEGVRFFETQVQPILKAHCHSCHSDAKKVKGGLHLTSRENLLKGGDSGPAVVIDRPDQSLLLQAVRYQEPKMPPKGKLPQKQIDILTRWVAMGAPWSAAPIQATAKRGVPAVDDEAKRFWSFRPVTRPALPGVKQALWVRNAIDAFTLAKLEAAGLLPAPPAEKAALVRRVYYDLLGLPPTFQEVAAFLADSSPDAYEKVIDRLLASPHYGEHWGRHWLDLVRYAETNSFERDGPKPNVWRYRDYVIRSFNADKPYDRFAREQLAGDELPEVTPETIIATGYYRLGQWDDEPVDREQAYYDGLDDIVGTTGQVFLGLTVNCARCHDHKIDPFPQKDYYRLLAFFHGIRHYAPGAATQRDIAVPDDRTKPEDRAKQVAALAAHKKQLADLTRQINEIEKKVMPYLQGGERDDFKFKENRPALVHKHAAEIGREVYDKYDKLQQSHLAISRNRPPGPTEALCVTETNPRDTFVLLRGNPQAHGEKVEPGFPSVLPETRPPTFAPSAKTKSSGRRRALAEWVVNPENPLTARVIVNRVWQYHFGRGLVRSASNYGYMGTPPTHPELLDWLANEFVAGGWRLKPLHKLILLSNTYRISSRPDPAALVKDPENDLYWRFDPRRLSAEEIRDSILAVSGNLQAHCMEGPSVYPPIPAEVLAGQSRPGAGWETSPVPERNRRSVYIHVKRSLAVPLLQAFDAADTDASCPVRFTTTQPTQALGMLNSDFLNEQAELFARDILVHGAAEPAQVRLALARSSQREPSAAEVERGVQFLRRARHAHGLSAEEALRSFCLLALNLNEFVHVD